MSAPSPAEWPSVPPTREALARLADALFTPGTARWGLAHDPAAIEPGDPAARRRGQREGGRRLLEELSLRPGARPFQSLTHSGPVTLALGVDLDPAGRGVGIDLERQARPVSASLFARFRSPGEQAIPMPPIALWAAKEACYKANPANAGTVIRQYRVTAFLPASGPGRVADGFVRYERQGRPVMLFRVGIVESEGWVVAAARASLPGELAGGLPGGLS
jgi:hypothetical protein